MSRAAHQKANRIARVLAAVAALALALVLAGRATGIVPRSGHYGYTKNCRNLPAPLCSIWVTGHKFYRLYGNDTDRHMYMYCTIQNGKGAGSNTGFGYGRCYAHYPGRQNNWAKDGVQYTPRRPQTIGWLAYYR